MSFFKSFVASLAVASTASAHMVITKPVPINAINLNNSPLSGKGTDFPCKFVSGGYSYTADSPENEYDIGSDDNELAFMGSAVHGGGSCQISLTYDRPPTKDSVWKVLTSIEGGCPARNTAGNFAANSASFIDPYTYNFTIPSGLEAGKYTLAWTWFNKIGNREMYMNCALVTLNGSGGSKSTYDALPDMMVGNIGNGCSTKDDTDVVFPDPGENLQKLNGATTAFASPIGKCTATGAVSAAATAATSVAATSAAAITTAASTTSAPYGGVFYPTSGDSSSAATSTPVTVTPISQGAAAVSQAPAAAATSATSGSSSSSNSSGSSGTSSTSSTSSSSGSGSGYTAGTACSDEGAWNCISGSSFQRCASGTWSAVQDMASGLTCTSGVSATLSYTATSRVKRAIRAGAKMLRF
ncbi:hypothetical protein TD95_002188 [Thielaviopsis punctulata]|uniref:Chitin-binding type-4 domain-containing protein n=1 Tax=Thielaviopsis punctulata TaxID=72032 RepID=A0A0F4ZGK6_9PEZI|nr:hypothetical protein TD95_002188 [Thielaviopsis punctulata]